MHGLVLSVTDLALDASVSLPKANKVDLDPIDDWGIGDGDEVR